MPRDYIPKDLRRFVTERARGYCEYCRSPGRFALESMEIEHIVPSSRSGGTEAENLALACHGCNNYKQNRIEGIDPVSAESAVLYHPRLMNWYEHFAWSADATLAIGLTATGRVTVIY
jgi:HNH endonuclease